MMLTRRTLLAVGAACSLFVMIPQGWAQEETAAESFVQDFGNKLVAVVNADGSLEQKQDTLRPLIDKAVDVDTIARFCLGRFVNTATPDQVNEFNKLFHRVLVDNITSKIGEFRGVTFKMGETTMRGTDALVGSTVTRPNQAPNDVRWVVSMAGGSPRIVDVIAEGTSLRLTQRSDYASFLSHHGNEVDALIKAMRQQVAAQG